MTRAVSAVAAVVLVSAGFLGRRDRRGGNSSSEEEPLLLLTGADFLRVLTFSWMAPLLAVGRAKTLVLRSWRR
jgi:hypothetical protein